MARRSKAKARLKPSPDPFPLSHPDAGSVPLPLKGDPAQEYRRRFEAEVADSSWKDAIPCPRWALRNKERKGTDEQLLDATIKVVRRAPTKMALQMAHMVLLRLGRRPQNNRLFRSKVTAALIREVQKKGRRGHGS